MVGKELVVEGENSSSRCDQRRRVEVAIRIDTRVTECALGTRTPLDFLRNYRVSDVTFNWLCYEAIAMFGLRTCARPSLIRGFGKRLQFRAIQSTPLVKAYPKEGVFQPDSPPREQPSQIDQLSQPQYPQPAQPIPHVARPPPNQRRRRIGRYLGLLILSSIGYVSAQLAAQYVLPVMPTIPGSPEDIEDWLLLIDDLEALPLVQELRKQMHEVDGVQQPVWREWGAYSGMTTRRKSRLTSGPLAGTAGVGPQHVFWNESTKEIVLFVGMQVVVPQSFSKHMADSLYRCSIRRRHHWLAGHCSWRHHRDNM